MRRFERMFAELESAGRAALVAYYPYGYPTLEASERVIEALAGVSDALEIGLPFSDPTADGPAIQRALAAALANGATVDRALGFTRRLRRSYDGPIAFMTYANVVYRRGVARFFAEAARAGADGLVVPDVPLEEVGVFAPGGAALDVILLAAPTTSDERLRAIARAARGFVYLVATLGTTGAREGVDEAGIELARRARAAGAPRACLGFGVATPAQAAAYAREADGVVIGSAIIQRVADGGDIDDIIERTTSFLSEIRASLARHGAHR